MINEDFCSFEVSKLLQEKGFDTITFFGYRPNGATFVGHWENWENGRGYPKPTHQMAMKWLREVHKLLIVVNGLLEENKYFYLIEKMTDGQYWDSDAIYNTHEEAVEAALKYCLTKIL